MFEYLFSREDINKTNENAKLHKETAKLQNENAKLHKETALLQNEHIDKEIILFKLREELNNKNNNLHMYNICIEHKKDFDYCHNLFK